MYAYCFRLLYINLKNFVLQNFSVLIFCVNIFSWSRIPIWNETTHQENRVLTACYVHGYYKAVGQLHTCEREAKNVVGTYCGSKDSWFIGHWVVSGHAFIWEVAVILEQQEDTTHYCTHMSFIILASSALTTRFRMMPELSAISAVSLWRTLWNSSTCSWKWLACIN